MQDSSNTSQAHTQKLTAELKKTWNKLSDQEIAFQASNPDKFYEAVKTKYSINKDEAEKTVKKLDADCAAACSTSNKSSDASSKPAPKTATA